MIILKIINASFLWILGLLLVRHVIKHWNRSGHILEKISEIFQSFLFFLIGYYITILYSNNNPFYLQLDFYIFIIFSSSVILFVGLNIFPNYLKKKFNKHYRANISYNSFISEVNEKYNILNSSKRSRIINDLSRKILHIIQFALLLLIYHISLAFSDFFSEWAYSPVEIRNFFFISFAGFFWIMIMSGELLRTDHWEYLPKWAWKWYKKSLDPNRELWRLNASIAILLTNLIWIHPIFPIQVLLIATWISCISDGMASIIGKNFGKHKIFLLNIQGKKTYEGLLAGISTTFIGVLLILNFYPVEVMSFLLIMLIGAICSLIFIFTDLGCKHINDNILNSLLPGLAVWLMLTIW